MDSETRELKIIEMRIDLLLLGAESGIRICQIRREQLATMLRGTSALRREINRLRKRCQTRLRRDR